ncbi:MAG: hypothetical protein A3D92_03890 [Bacteroidetes bacterium RIFCSPHIGHO2_02_FULL_44_7]|nr:MAG: hypothetical protein A3D92_03890 [Bacteroidetes bacterium RIFCSPHIGHO2_02_FULL_44_7]
MTNQFSIDNGRHTRKLPTNESYVEHVSLAEDYHATGMKQGTFKKNWAYLKSGYLLPNADE